MAAKPGEKYRIGGNGWWRLEHDVRIKTTDVIEVVDIDDEYVHIAVHRRGHKIGSKAILHNFFKEDFVKVEEK